MIRKFAVWEKYKYKKHIKVFSLFGSTGIQTQSGTSTFFFFFLVLELKSGATPQATPPALFLVYDGFFEIGCC
jgi:hypothetical protein